MLLPMVAASFEPIMLVLRRIFLLLLNMTPALVGRFCCFLRKVNLRPTEKYILQVHNSNDMQLLRYTVPRQ